MVLSVAVLREPRTFHADRPAGREISYTVSNGVSHSGAGSVAYREIGSIRVYGCRRGLRGAPEMVCVIRGRGQTSMRISSLMRTGRWVEDRMEEFLPFTDELLRSYRAADPAARVVVGGASALRWVVLVVLVGIVCAGGVVLLRDWISVIGLRHMNGSLALGTVQTLLWSAPAVALLRRV